MVSSDSCHTYPFELALKLFTIAWHLAFADAQEEHIKSAARTVLSIGHYTKCRVEFGNSKMMYSPLNPLTLDALKLVTSKTNPRRPVFLFLFFIRITLPPKEYSPSGHPYTRDPLLHQSLKN